MSDTDGVSNEERRLQWMRLYGPVPRLKSTEKKRVRGKVFRSGNSLAFRIPAGTKLSAGMEMELTIEDGQHLTLGPVEQPKRKFNIAKVAGSAQNLKPFSDGDRVFEERALAWGSLRAMPDTDV